jgi:hypothetical protein
MRCRGPVTGLIALALAGCPPPSHDPSDGGPDGPHGCTLSFLGDEGQDPQIELIALGAGQQVVPVNEGGPIAILIPPQGGRVIFVGVRATNVDPCAIKLAGALRDETSKQVTVDTRTVNLTPAAGGWGESDGADISSFSNVAVCPNEWATRDIYGVEYELVMTVTDRGGRTATRTVHVVPDCAEPENLAVCQCICKGGYVLGESCADAGAGDAGSDGGP